MGVSVVTKYLFNGQERSIKAKKNILYSFFLKGGSIVINLLLVPLILGYIDNERYGIWLTISSIITWFSFFDIGLGNGLRNKIAEEKAKNNDKLVKTYVSTTYVILTLIFSFILLIFSIINKFINWQKILNTTFVDNSELAIIAEIVFVFFFIQFVLKLIGSILLADQRPAVSNSFGPLGNLISLIIIFILTKFTQGSLVYLTLTLSLSPVLVLLFANFLFFRTDYNKYSPSIRHVDFSKVKDLLGLGVKFFILQIASIVFYSSTNILIAQMSSQYEVTNFNISYKLFAIVIMINSIILSPIWSATTDAYVRKDFDWIKNVLKKLLMVILALSLVLVIILVFSKKIILFWVGDKVEIPVYFNTAVFIYVLLQLITSPFSAIINGFGKLQVSIYSILIRLLIFFPLAIFLGKEYGAVGIVITMILIQIIPLITSVYQVFYIVNTKGEKKNSIWLK